jgi:hypothetical protein
VVGRTLRHPRLVSPGRSRHHVAVPIDRRSFCLTVAGTLAAACSTAPAETPRQGLGRLLGLKGSEESWLDALSSDEQRDLHEALRHSSQQTSRRTIDLVMKVLGRRERLFAYVGYPELPRVGVCDGLIRE